MSEIKINKIDGKRQWERMCEKKKNGYSESEVDKGKMKSSMLFC